MSVSFVTTITNPASNMAKVEHKDTIQGVTNNGFEQHEMKAQTNGAPASKGGAVTVDLRRRMSEAPGAMLSAHNVSYSVKVSTKCCGESVDKQILKNVTGVFKPGLNAIMGPSGSGKTSFLNAIADRLNKDNVKGKILVDGQNIPQNFKCMVGFVVQDDIVMGTLTVRENFAFSAALRLPSRIKKSQRNELVEDVIRELGLTQCADSKIGTPFIRGVSGGERKRCNIGMELIISPPVLFLDEPTSGLDANTANSVLMELRKIADRGRTIIFSIHQPRYSIYKLFDNLMLLSKGQTVYHGPATQALDFFEQQGYKCQTHNNPPDFFLDIINADQSTLSETAKTNEIADPQAMQEKITKGFEESSWNQKLQAEASQIFSQSEGKGDDQKSKRNVDYATSVFNQMLVVAGRSFRDLVRNPQTGVAVVGSSIFFALLLMGIYWQLDDDPVTAFSDRRGLFFFMVMVQMFFNLGAMEIYHKEKVIYLHENVSGYYRPSVYFLVKVFADVIPLRMVAVSAMSAIVYFGAGLRDEAGAFFLFVLCLFLVSMMASALCLFMAYSFQTFAAAQMLMALIYMIMMLFSGFLINLGSVGDWFSWMQYWSMVKFGLEGLYVNEFKDRNFCNDDGTDCQTGNLFMEQQNVDHDTDFDFWVNYLALFLLTLGLFVLAYIQLRRMKRSM